MPGAAPIGVPNFFIDKFRIPPFLLSLYQAAGVEYGVRWEVLAAINEIETDYGRNLNVSSAGALGWMQFMPATWKQYGVDANGDERKDPYNPVDAIFSAARYLRAAGAEEDLRKAIFAYNHADWYVDSVLMRARLIGGLPSNLVGSLTGLTQGMFPVAAQGALRRRPRRGRGAASASPRAATPRCRSSPRRRAAGSTSTPARAPPVVAVQDGKIVKIGQHRAARPVRPAARRLRQHVHVRAARQARQAPPGAEGHAAATRPLAEPPKDPAPTPAASAGTQAAPRTARRPPRTTSSRRAAARSACSRTRARPRAWKAGGREQVEGQVAPRRTSSCSTCPPTRSR